MPSESGDMKLLGNFSKLIELITDPNYNPANAKIKVPALTTQKTTALAAVADVGAKEAPFKSVTNDRQDAYEPLPGVMSRSGNMLKASGASKKIRDDAMTLARKITASHSTVLRLWQNLKKHLIHDRRLTVTHRRRGNRLLLGK